MNLTAIARALSGMTMIFGLIALLFPAWSGDFLFDMTSRDPRILGEVGATIGGPTIVLGALGLYGSLVVGEAGRGWVQTLALVWLGTAGARLLGVFLHGSPNWFGWFSMTFETLVGVLLLVSSMGLASLARRSSVSGSASSVPATSFPPSPTSSSGV